MSWPCIACMKCCVQLVSTNALGQHAKQQLPDRTYAGVHALVHLPISCGLCAQVTSQYRGFARQAMVYEQGRFEVWRATIDNVVLSHLRQAPLTQTASGKCAPVPSRRYAGAPALCLQCSMRPQPADPLALLSCRCRTMHYPQQT